MRRDVLLFALENRFGVARFPLILNRTGCRITVLGKADTMVCSSRFVDRVILYKIRLRKGSVSTRQVGRARVGMSYEQIIERLGPPVHEAVRNFRLSGIA
jgi:hypothetical protein